MNPRFPLYIPTKGRADSRYTDKALDAMGVPHRLVIEEQEYDLYAREVDENKLLVLDPRYQAEYDTLDDLGGTKSRGPGPARNFIWEHSMAEGHAWHWVMDDNIKRFHRLYYNQRIKLHSGVGFRIMEDFVLRYTNVAMAGPQYSNFCPPINKFRPFMTNRRIYSCNLIRNDVPFRWRGRYNEDTILSLDMMKAGWCTIEFNAILQDKICTQVVKGGNTAEFYAHEGTLPKSQMLVDAHPDVARLMVRYGRHHHFVDYRPFAANKLCRRPDIGRKNSTNNYGMDVPAECEIWAAKRRAQLEQE